jgi:Tfp pilus assembly pilus retraction ATPase PilT
MANEIQMGRKYQMQSMDMALLELYQRGDITYDTAASCARDPNVFKKKTA